MGAGWRWPPAALGSLSHIEKMYFGGANIKNFACGAHLTEAPKYKNEGRGGLPLPTLRKQRGCPLPRLRKQ